jgi:hypothetical protein
MEEYNGVKEELPGLYMEINYRLTWEDNIRMDLRETGWEFVVWNSSGSE